MDGYVTLDEARRRMLAAIHRLLPETVEVSDALGRYLADDIVAGHDQPPFDASAMDGYAVRQANAAATAATFRVIGETSAGASSLSLNHGTAIRIFTGAVMPNGADMVVPLERASSMEGDRVSLGPLNNMAANVRKRGGDFSSGEILLTKGWLLDPWRISLLASSGRSHALVNRKPRVMVLTTGNELAAPGSQRHPAQIFESNGYAIAALVRWWGGIVVVKTSVQDDPAAISKAVRDSFAFAPDLIVAVGGASVGKYDLVKPALSELGLRLCFDRLRIRPGKPCWFGLLSNGIPVLGLPGNPSAALVGAQLLMKPLMLHFQGANPTPIFDRATLSASLRGGSNWERFERARLVIDTNGTLIVSPFLDQDSGRVKVFAAATALIKLPLGLEDANAGDVVDILRLDRPGITDYT